MISNFFTLLNDVSLLMDNIATNTKIAVKNTAAVVGDDVAVNASKTNNFDSSREYLVIWKIMKGSFLNKIIIIPIILFLNYFFPKLIDIALILGAIFLSYEAVGGIKIFFKKNIKKKSNPEKDLSEDEKIKSAIQTDFILSIEIILVALNSVAHNPFVNRIIVILIVAFVITLGVYGLVLLLIRLDDIGLFLARGKDEKSFRYKLGMKMVKILPVVVETLSIIGIFAMLLVAGNIFLEKIKFFDIIENNLIFKIITAFIVGIVILFILKIWGKIFKKKK